MKVNLESQSWAASALRLIPLSILPPGKRIKRISLYFSFAGSKAGGAAVTAAEYPTLVSSVKIGPRWLNQTGQGLADAARIVYGKDSARGSDLTSGGTSAQAFAFELSIDFCDPRQPGITDGAIPTELLASRNIEIQFGSATAIATDTLTIASGTVSAMVELFEETGIPQMVEIGYFDPGSQTIMLEPGIYQDLWLTDGAPTGLGTVAVAEVTQVDLEADGQLILNNAAHAQLVHAFNREATGDAASELTVATPRFLPIVWPKTNHGHLTKALAVEKQAALRLSGTETAPRVHFRRIPLKDEATVNAVAALTGAPAGGAYEPQTATKSEARTIHRGEREGRVTRKSRLMFGALAGKIRRSPTKNTLR